GSGWRRQPQTGHRSAPSAATRHNPRSGVEWGASAGRRRGRRIQLGRQDIPEPVRNCARYHGHSLVRASVFRSARQGAFQVSANPLKRLRGAIYPRVSTDNGLDQEFNSLDAQHEAAEAYIRSQAHEGWSPIRTRYDDGGYSGGSTDRPALQRLLADVRDRKV